MKFLNIILLLQNSEKCFENFKRMKITEILTQKKAK